MIDGIRHPGRIIKKDETSDFIRKHIRQNDKGSHHRFGLASNSAAWRVFELSDYNTLNLQTTAEGITTSGDGHSTGLGTIIVKIDSGTLSIFAFCTDGNG